jgi:hypothetical protein
MENVYLKHHEIKKQLRQIITEEYQEKHDFVCIPTDDPKQEIKKFSHDICERYNKIGSQAVRLEQYMYIVPDIKHNRLVIRF